MNPEQHLLHSTQWQFFATLTFKRDEMSDAKRLKLFFAFGRKACKWFGVYFPRLKWALRLEAGEKNGRLHYHVLIAGLPESAVIVPTCHALEKLWETRMRVGIAKIRTWEKGRDAISYITKSQSEFSIVGANQYESKKFGNRCVVILSESLLKLRRGDEGRTKPHLGTASKGLNSAAQPRSGIHHEVTGMGCSPENPFSGHSVVASSACSSGHVRRDMKGAGVVGQEIDLRSLSATFETGNKANWKSTGNGLFVPVDDVGSNQVGRL